MFQGPQAPTANAQSATNSPTTTDWCSQCYAYQSTDPNDLNNVVSMCCPTNDEDYTSCLTGCMTMAKFRNHGELSKKTGIQECVNCLTSCGSQAGLFSQVSNCGTSYYQASGMDPFKNLGL
uniref:Uncharacterized protein n=1 Tax=Acrobeloides nanus TaxID=290746 RepID=A0A914EEQ5_9BILA